MRIVVYEPVWAGHTPDYCHLFIKAFEASGCSCIPCIPQALHNSDHWIKINPWNPPFNRVKRGLYSMVRLLEAAWLAHEQAAVLFIPSLDQLIVPLEFNAWVAPLLPTGWFGLHMHGYSRRNRQVNIVLRFLLQNAAQSSSGWLTLDEFKHRELETLLGKPVVAIPDISEIHPQAILAADHKIFDVGIFGVLSERKNVRGLVQALLLIDTPLKIILAGKGGMVGDEQDPELENLFARIRLRHDVKCVINHLSHEQMDTYIAQTRIAFCCSLNYPYSSNIATKAVHLKTKILVASNTLLDDRIKKYGGGLAADPLSPESIKTALALLLGADDILATTQYADKHSIVFFDSIIAEFVKSQGLYDSAVI